MLKLIKNYWPTALAGLILLTALTGAYAKYVTEKSLSGTLTVQANIGTVTVQEHMAEKQSDGSYKLLDTTTVQSNTYDTVLPGLDLPKDPHVVISGVTADIPVYVFVEIVNGLGESKITYEVDTNWTELKNGDTAVTGKNGGSVYVYKNGTPVSADLSVYILKNNQVVVSQKLDKAAKNLSLTFYASMAQTAAGTPAEAYQIALTAT